MLNDADVNRVLVVAAHPDDIDFGCAGTVAAWTEAGIEVAYCLVTNGDAGGFDPEVPRADIAGIRQAEQRAAAAAVGVSDITFLGYPDGRVAVTYELRRDISRQIRRLRPERVLSPSPERNYQHVYASHPDHLAVGEAALCAVYPDARNPFAHPELLAGEGLEAHTVREVWVMGAPLADHYLDVTETFDRKMKALRAHVSQVSHMTDLEDMMRNWMGERARTAGLGEDRLAEVFRVVETG